MAAALYVDSGVRSMERGIVSAGRDAKTGETGGTTTQFGATVTTSGGRNVAVAHGGTSIEDPPGPREGPAGTLHLSYVRDPDGNKLCALHRPKA